MALFTKSLQTSYSHTGFKSLFSVRSIFFCCSNSETETPQKVNVVANDDTEDEKSPDFEKDKMDGKTTPSQETTLPVENSQNENMQNEENRNDDNFDQINSQPAEYQLEPEPERVSESDPEQEIEPEPKVEEISYQDENETPEGNTISTIDDFDNISDHEINPAVIVNKADKKKTGDLRIKIGFDAEKSALVMTILTVHDFARPSSSTNSIREHPAADVPPVLAYSVHILVTQIKKHRYKTKMRQGPDPFFDEIIKITKVNLEDAKKWCLRFRLYGSLRNSIKQVIGEGFLPLDKIELERRMQCDISLMTHDPTITEDAMNTLMYASHCKFESTTSLVSLDKNSNFIEVGATPELFFGLAFNFSTGRLTIDIKRGNRFPKLKDNKIPDTFIRVILLGSRGEEMFSTKTAVKKSSCEPVFDESFIFQVFMFQLDDITLTIEGYHKLKLGKKFLFGSITIGSKVGEGDRLNHWKDLLTTKNGDQLARWHSFDLVNV